MRKVRRLLSAILILLGITTIIPAFAGIVSAHHSNIAASVQCSGVVSWTASSWATGPEGTNPDVRVSLTVGPTTTEIAQGVFNDANNYQFSGTFQWPAGATSITVSSLPVGTWGNGVVSVVGSSVTITKPGNCPGQPGVSVAVSCSTPSAGHGDGTVVLTLSNDVAFASNVTFNVYNPDQAAIFTAYTVAPGQTQQVTFGGLADGPHSVKITAGATDLSQAFSVDCDSPIPAATNAVTCVNGDGQVVVTLSNTGGEAVVFDVTNPQTNMVEHVTVDADSSTTRTFSGFADGDYTVTIMVGANDLSQDFTVACDHPGAGTISVTSACVDHDGQVTITLIATGGNQPVVFVVNGTTYLVPPDTTLPVVISGLNDGSTPISVTANGKDLSFVASSTCDLPPTYSYAQACANFDDTVSVTIANPGDDATVTFTINGTDYPLTPGASQIVVIDHLADGPHTITLAINHVPQPSIVVTSHCDATFVVAPVCNSVDVNGAVTTYWYTITNSESTNISVTWDNGGSGVVPAGQSITVGSSSPTLTVQQGQLVIGQANASTVTCTRDVTVTKKLNGQPQGSETYTIQVSRLVGATYVPVMTFDLQAGGSTTIHLPSTFDPAGVDYTIAETNAGTATVSTVSPDQLKLLGNVGDTVAVTVTNSYASVHIDKTTLTQSVTPGGQITYTLQAQNTGGLILNPVVVTDRLPSSVSYVSATVAGNAGVCSLAQAARPQLISCTMNGSLAPGVFTSLITVVVQVDATVSPGLTIVNQASVHGAYEGTADLAQNVTTASSAGGDLSCIPVIADSVCNISAAIGVPVTLSIVASSPPVPASSSQVVALPRTGASNLGTMLALGFGAILLGGALLLSKRRIGAR